MPPPQLLHRERLRRLSRAQHQALSRAMGVLSLEAGGSVVGAGEGEGGGRVEGDECVRRTKDGLTMRVPARGLQVTCMRGAWDGVVG